MRSITSLFTVAMLAGLLPAYAVETSSGHIYSIKQDEPVTGSHIRRELIRGGHVPFDKRYSELTVDERNFARTEYADALSDDQEPPFPENGLRPIFVELRKAGQNADWNFKGYLVAYVEVDKSGLPKSASVLDAPSPAVTLVTKLALMSQKYKPATCNGNPCDMKFKFHARFFPWIPDTNEISHTGKS